MSRLLRSAATVIAIMACASANARTHHKNQEPSASARAGLSDMEIRQQCFAEARQRYPSTSQDVQTNRLFTYTTCASSHGIRP
jgi:hypothetical protein